MVQCSRLSHVHLFLQRRPQTSPSEVPSRYKIAYNAVPNISLELITLKPHLCASAVMLLEFMTERVKQYGKLFNYQLPEAPLFHPPAAEQPEELYLHIAVLQCLFTAQDMFQTGPCGFTIPRNKIFQQLHIQMLWRQRRMANIQFLDSAKINLQLPTFPGRYALTNCISLIFCSSEGQ